MASILAYQTDRVRPYVSRPYEGPRTAEEMIAADRARHEAWARLRPPMRLPAPAPIDRRVFEYVAAPVQLIVKGADNPPLPKEQTDAISRQMQEAHAFFRERLPKCSFQRIMREVCEFYCVRELDIVSKRRSAHIVRPRHVAMYLAKTITKMSLPQISKRLGGRDHTTALSGVRKIERLLAADEPGLADAIAAIKAKLAPAENAG